MLRGSPPRRLRCPDPPSGLTALLDRLRAERGFTLIELMIATLILLTAGPPIAAVLLSGSQLSSSSFRRTAADELAAAKIELVRALPYDDIGFPGGNPPGTIAGTDQLFYGPSTLDGHDISIAYQFSYVNDHGAKTTTYADYKRVVVTITDTTANAVVATKTANIAALTGAAGGGSEFVTIRRLVVDMATGSPPLANVSVNLASGPSAPRAASTDSAGSVIFPALTVNPNTSNFYNVTASLSGYSTYPTDLPYTGTGNPAISLEHVNHLTGNDDLQTIHMYKSGIAVTANVYKSDGVTPFGSTPTVYMGAGLAGNTATASGSPTSASINQLQLGNRYLSPIVTTIPIFPGNYTFAAQYGNAGSMTYSTPQTVAIPSNYPTVLTQTVNLVMNPNPCTTNTTLTVTVKRGSSTVQDAHVEVSSASTTVANAPNVYVWGDTNSSGQVVLIVPRGKNFAITATDARGSTVSLLNQQFSSSTATATVTVTP